MIVNYFFQLEENDINNISIESNGDMINYIFVLFLDGKKILKVDNLKTNIENMAVIFKLDKYRLVIISDTEIKSVKIVKTNYMERIN